MNASAVSYVTFDEQDTQSPISYSYSVEEVVCRRRTKHHELLVFRNAYWGKVMVLNNIVQFTERDEHLYHEMIAHVGLHAHPCPTDVLIIGGGDGGTLREVLKHRSVSNVLVAELDAEVIEVCKEYFPAMGSGFSDSRVHVVEADGVDLLGLKRGEFDLIIVDSTESLHFHRRFVRQVQRRLGAIFKLVDLYTVPLSTYAGNWWTFSIASKVHDPSQMLRKCEVPTKYYAEDVHRHAFLPRSLYRKLMVED
ncbi:MAG: spermidine synthase [Chloroflexi bacterium]|nr:spermidine synthase [Chloroflexota bacterium]